MINQNQKSLQVSVFLYFIDIILFRNVGGNIRDGITGFSGSVMSKPREFAHLIKNKFGSADNINEMGGKVSKINEKMKISYRNL